MNITIQTIPHKEQRYDTVGDWQFTEAGDLTITVSAMPDWRYEALVAFHEFAEALLCQARGITAEQVDAFDKAFIPPAGWSAFLEPGDDPAAPYRKEHFFATTVERMLAAEFGFDWHTYDEAVGAL